MAAAQPAIRTRRTDRLADMMRVKTALRHHPAAFWLIGLASAIAYGLTPTAAAIGYAGGVSPAVLVCLRSLVGAVLLLGFAWATGRLRRVPLRPALGLSLVCGPLFGLQLLCFFAAVRITGAQVAVVLVHVYPLVVLLLLWLGVGSRVHRGQLLLAVLMTGGIALVAGSGATAVAPLGAVSALLCAVGYALYLVVGERWIRQTSALTAGGLAALGAGVTSGAIALIGRDSFSFAPTGWASILAQGLVLMPIGIAGSFLAVRALGSGPVSLLGLLEPVVGVLAAQLFLGENLSAPQWAGMTVVLVTSAILPWAGARRPARTTPATPPDSGARSAPNPEPAQEQRCATGAGARTHPRTAGRRSRSAGRGSGATAGTCTGPSTTPTTPGTANTSGTSDTTRRLDRTGSSPDRRAPAPQ